MSIFVIVIAFLNVATGFVPIHRVTDGVHRYSKERKMVATVETVSIPNIVESDAPIAWECDDNANCVAVSACDEVSCRTSLDVRIHGKWYDLSGEQPFLFVFSSSF